MADEGIDRRRFLRDGARAAAALALAGTAGVLSHARRGARIPEVHVVHRARPPGEPAGMSAAPESSPALLALVRRGDVGEGPVDGGDLTRRAIESLGGIDRFVSRGDRVLVKPNIGWNRTPEQAANTAPAVVAAVVSLCRDAGAREVIVTDNTCNDPRMCFERSGIESAAREAGATVFIPDEKDWVKVDMEGRAMGQWTVLRALLDADRVVSVPVAKQHGLAGYTGAMKNFYGVVGGKRGRLHHEIDQSIVDMARFSRPVLGVLDATRVLLANGPSGGDLADVERRDTVVASSDLVALDALGCTLIGRSVTEIGHIPLAADQGLGLVDPGGERKVEVVL